MAKTDGGIPRVGTEARAGVAADVAATVRVGATARATARTTVLTTVAVLAGAGAAITIPGAPAWAAQQVPTPESVLGHRVGADFHLTTFEESIAYFERLDEASDRLELRQVGRSSYGRPVYIALISSAENLRDLERYREIAQRLAHPKGLDDDEARALAAEGRAIVHIDGGLHSTEVAHAEHTIQLAHDLVTGDADPEIRAILDNVILLLWPSMNPDGQTMITEWYRSNVGTPTKCRRRRSSIRSTSATTTTGTAT